mmetsp:Transcript_35239/g.86468  ORF Transcript_35239/g.86468 Transcript_35239/m.86468 type:complete len:140 (+) Transcript_35239:430-849(+)
MQSYKENRLATAGYFSATVAGASLVVKSHHAEPLSGRGGGGGAGGALERPKSARPASATASFTAAAARRGKNPTAGRPEWARPTSGLASTKAALARPDLEQLRSGPGGEWTWDMRGGGRGGGAAMYASIVQPQWNSRVK